LVREESIKVYLTKIPEHSVIPDDWMAGMAHEKCDRICRLKNEKDRQLATLAHRLLCYSLSVQFGIYPSACDWATGWHGKPYLKNVPYVHFNISHSGSVAMCALHSAPVGVDIERINTVDSMTAWRIMSKDELAAFNMAQDRNSFFYKIWTLKEAYIKYNGRGIGCDLQALSVYPDKDNITTNIPGCQFALIDAADGYQAAVCASNASHRTQWVSEESLCQF